MDDQGEPGEPPASRSPFAGIATAARRPFFLVYVLLVLIEAIQYLGQHGETEIIELAAVAVLGIAAVMERGQLAEVEGARRTEAEGFARILRRLSSSVSPDAIVAAIMDELGATSGADHVGVVRRQPDARSLEATVSFTRSGAPPSRTFLSLAELDDPGHREPSLLDTPADQRIADRIAGRLAGDYGLHNTLAAPLRIGGRVEGAIVLSRRTDVPWDGRAGRLLEGAAIEASSALARAYTLREAEVRAATDALTGLPNRRSLDEYLALLERRRRVDDQVGILMIDIDLFKGLNDAFGHAAGDHVLRNVARAIADAVREGDVATRFGGEEFAVVLRNPGEAVALEVGERVRRGVAELDFRGLGVDTVTVSVGVAVARTGEADLHEVVERADQALLSAKRAGRNRVAFG
jgi:diguanylate cyclase (GGDEF)-like protein